MVSALIAILVIAFFFYKVCNTWINGGKNANNTGEHIEMTTVSAPSQPTRLDEMPFDNTLNQQFKSEAGFPGLAGVGEWPRMRPQITDGHK